jgi:branched-chain amino acid transport system permease protein
MDLLLQAVASGVVIGSVYSLIALSIAIIYKSTDMVNFAGGEFVMVGGYIALFGLQYLKLPYPLACGFVVLITFGGGMAFDQIVLRRILATEIKGQPLVIALVIATVGLSYLLKGLVRLVPYTEQVRRLPPAFSGAPIFIGPVVLQRQDIAIVVATVTIMAAIALFFNFTLAGKALRALSENPRAAMLIGIPLRRARSLIWGLAASLAGLAGVLLSPKLLLTPDSGGIIIVALAAAIIGGITSLVGCVVGGITLGIVENLVGIFISPRAMAPVPFMLIMLLLCLRPQGLFGGTVQIRKV